MKNYLIWCLFFCLSITKGFAQTPTLNSVSPNTINQGTSFQFVSLNGSGFTSSSFHQFSLDGGSSWGFAGAAPTFNSSTSLSVAINNTVIRTIRVRVCASNGSSACSSSFPVTVQASVVTPPMPANPTPGTTANPGPTLGGTSVTMSWSASSGATYYSFGVRDMDTNQLIVDTTTTSTSYSANLAAGKPYRWNVAACNTAATPCSAFTTPLNFQTPSAVVTPTLNSVSPNTINQGTSFQFVTLNGSNFTSASFHQFSLNNGSSWTFATSAPTFNSATSLSVAVNNINLGTVLVRVCASNGSAACSGSLPVTVQSVVVTPTLNSVSPNTINQGTSFQFVTLSGSNFTSASFHQFSLNNGSTWSFASSAPTFNSATSLGVAVNNINLGTVLVRVCASNGSAACSGSASVTVQSVVVTPTLNSVSPNTINQGTSFQFVTLSGSNFTSASFHQFSLNNGSSWTFATSAPTFNSTTSLSVAVNNINLGTVLVRVCASNGSTACSGSLPVTVQSVVVTPTLNSVSPNTINQGTSFQFVTLSGSNFTSSSFHQFSLNNGSSWTFATSAPTLNSATSLGVAVNNINLGTVLVRVCASNSSAACSGSLPVTVQSGSKGPGPFTLTVTPTCENSAPMNRLDWTAANNATGYQVIRDGSNVGGINNTQTFRNLSVTAGTQYSYVVRASNATGTTDSSAVSATTLSNCSTSLLNPPDLTLPINAASNVGVTPMFTWQPVPTANRYWLTVATSATLLPNNTSASTCAGCVVSGNTTLTSHTLNTGFPAGGRDPALALGTTYSWQVQAYTISGSVVTQQGNFSAIRTFSTSAAPPTPATPINLTPGDAVVPGAVQPSRFVNLSWQPGPGSTPSNYRVYVRESTTSTVTSFTATTTTYEYTGASDKSYAWNVAACNASGCSTVTPQQERFFRTPVAPALAIPGVPQPTSQNAPLPGDTETSHMPIFKWQSVPGASHYKVTILFQTGADAQYNDKRATELLYQPGPLIPGQRYKWTVVGCNANDVCSPPSSPRYFIAGSAPTTLPSPLTSSPGSNVLSSMPVIPSLVDFSWISLVGFGVKISVTDLSCGTGTKDYTRFSSLVSLGVFGGNTKIKLKNGCAYKWSVEQCVDCQIALNNNNKLVKFFRTTVSLPEVDGLRPGRTTAPGSFHQFSSPEAFRLNWRPQNVANGYRITLYGDGLPLIDQWTARPPFNLPPSILTASRYMWSVNACEIANQLDSCDLNSEPVFFQNENQFVVVPPNVRQLAVPSVSQIGLVLIAHGYNDSSAGWASPLAKKICEKTGGGQEEEIGPVPNLAHTAYVCNSPKWKIVAFDWSSFALFSGLPWNARTNAAAIGKALRISSQYKYLHLVGHSAGSALIREIARANPDRITHSTFLDAFCEKNNAGCEYGIGSTWAEQYYTDESREDAIATRSILPLAINFEIDSLNDYLFSDGQMHSFPHMQYRASSGIPVSSILEFKAKALINSFNSGPYNLGAPLSAEMKFGMSSTISESDLQSHLSGLSRHFSSSKGKRCILSLEAPSNPCGTTNRELQLLLNAFAPTTSSNLPPAFLCQGNISNGTYTTRSCPNNLASKLKSTTGAAPLAGYVAADVVAQTEANALEFDFKFNTTGQADALQVFINETLVYIERNINTTNWTSTDRISIQTMVPGTHSVRVAVVSEGTAAEVQVRNIRFSNVTLVDDEIFVSRFEDGETNAGSGALGTPDLAISEGESYVNTLVAGQDQTVGFKVQNSGTNVSRSTYASVRWMADNSGSTCTGQLISSVEVPNIENGSDQRLTLNLPVPTAPGRYFACITVDENRVAGQANYANDVTFAGPFDVIAASTITPALDERFDGANSNTLSDGWTEINEVNLPQNNPPNVGFIERLDGALSFTYQFNALNPGTVFGRSAATKALGRTLTASVPFRFSARFSPHADTRVAHQLALIAEGSTLVNWQAGGINHSVPNSGLGVMVSKSGPIFNNSTIHIVSYNGTNTPSIIASSSSLPFQFTSGLWFTIQLERLTNGGVTATISNSTQSSSITASAPLLVFDRVGVFDVEAGVSSVTSPSSTAYRTLFDDLRIE
jgi:pimeloyl-ACP methyl ester carboxylesterase/energy-converting hydrogenase Eha subunit B